MRQHCVRKAQENATQNKADGGRNPRLNPLVLGHTYRGSQQRPEARRDHDAGRKAQHHIEQFLRHGPAEHDDRGPHRRDRPREDTRHKALADRAELVDPLKHGNRRPCYDADSGMLEIVCTAPHSDAYDPLF